MGFLCSCLYNEVPAYNELLAELDALKANVESESAKQAAQAVIDSLKTLLSWLKQKDAEQMPNASWEFAGNLMVIYLFCSYLKFRFEIKN